MPLKIAIIALLAMFFAPQEASAQQTGLLKGQITDKADAGIGWAQVVVTLVSEQRQFSTDQEGRYELALRAGEYTVAGKANAFHSSREIKVRVTAGQTTEMNISLDVKNPVCTVQVKTIPGKDKTAQEQKAQAPVAGAAKLAKKASKKTKK